MANVIKHKRGSGSDPSASDLILGELAIRTDTGKLFTKMDSGAIAEIAGGGSDIAINTLSSSSATGGGSATFNGSAYRFTLSAPPSVSAQQLLVSINGVIQKPVAGTGQPSEGFSVDGTDIILGDAPATGSDFFILTFKSLGVSEPADNSVTSAKIVDGAIVNADINASAAIAGSKLNPVGLADVGIGTSSPGANLEVNKGSVGTYLKVGGDNASNGRALTFTSSTGNTGSNGALHTINATSSNGAIALATGSSEALRIDSSGRLLIGTTSSQTLDNSNCSLQVIGSNFSNSSFTQQRYVNSVSGPSFLFAKSRSGTIGTQTIVQNGDELGKIRFYGSDGNDFDNYAAEIKAIVDGTPGSNDMPGRLVFLTTADGAAAPTERMRISQNGDIAVNFDGSGSQTGVFQIADGSASSPGLTFWADGAKDTGIFRSGANTLNFSTAGSERMRIKSDGTVGIGTTDFTTVGSPNKNFVVGSTTNAQEVATTLNVMEGTNNRRVKFFLDDDDGVFGIDSTASTGVAPFVVRMAQSEKLRIDQSGHVLVNTTSVGGGSYDQLSVAGGIKITDDTNSKLEIGRYNSSTNIAHSYIKIGSNSGSLRITNAADSADLFTISNDGNVGIGTTSPGSKLHVANDNSFAAKFGGSGGGSNYFIEIGQLGTSSSAGFNATGTSGSMLFQIDGSEKMRIAHTTGNVGIGTSSPTNKLHVEDSASGVIVAKQTTNNGGFNTFEGKSSGGTTTFYASHNGRVGASEGIIFGSDTAADNVLDDYEEGTWTPVYTNAGGFSTDNSVGKYTKIGRVVNWVCQVAVIRDTSSASGTFKIGGLPFTSLNGATGGHGYAGCMGALFNWNIPNTAYQIGIRVPDNQSFIQFFANFDNAADSQLTSPFDASKTIFGSLSGTYIT